ncbi:MULTISPECIES: hemerythrin domain-containing protein [unclassified Halomonas]|uniref:hemerythrin domain-containing protein n=1 Tax=unclassified Halomonas TaxID=2609666 RepID=UPI002886AD40|nr:MULTISPECIES: hemerythrin domain-containing protein [unclassified Halomonas]MDT0499758.1 hemerythrin domain-containing protein [Halomonas sp. PAR7]MDT0510425.1 hemerythrin domain-containing protein [Halomonas sp. LES1]MDT0589866.1 hemerythrin domain-containing protein [Halomonas sp. PAR8]
MTIFEALRESHDKQRRLLSLLVETSGDSEGRDELYRRLRAELINHAGAEERSLYVPMMEYDLTQEKARHSVAEHHEIDEALEALDTTDYSSPGWLAAARKLQELVLHHLEEEEQEVFQLAGRVFDDTTKSKLARTYREEMQERETP